MKEAQVLAGHSKQLLSDVLNLFEPDIPYAGYWWAEVKQAWGPLPDPWLTMLNPQPLPPRFKYAQALADAFIDRNLLMQQFAELSGAGTEQGIIIVGGRVRKLVDDLCPDPPRIPRFPPKTDGEPIPRPNWGAADLAVVALVFQRAAKQFEGGIRDIYLSAAKEIMAVAEQRLQ